MTDEGESRSLKGKKHTPDSCPVARILMPGQKVDKKKNVCYNSRKSTKPLWGKESYENEEKQKDYGLDNGDVSCV